MRPILPAVLAAAVSLSVAQPTLRIHATGGGFFDSFGRWRLFHGFNDVGSSKGSGHTPGGAAYLPKHVLIPALAQQLQELGFNALRMPAMWSGAMPGPDTIDAQYLATLSAGVDALGARGIYSVLDMHQDVLSSKFGGYDGAPLWLVNRSTPRKPYPFPFKPPLASWSEGYLAEAVGQAFQDIYDNKHGGLDAWRRFWSAVATEFKGHTAVLGYELINEPWAGDVWAEPTRLLPGVAGGSNLLPAYDSLSTTISEVDDETIIFYEPVTWGVVLPGSSAGTGTGFSRAPNGTASRSALSYHYYCWFGPIDGPGGNLPFKPTTRRECDQLLGPEVFRTAVHDAERVGSAGFLTEFGAQTPNITLPNATETAQLLWILDVADRQLQSWTYWDISSLVAPGNTGFKMDNMLAFVRVYASAVAGTPLSMRFDREARTFDLSFRTSPAITAPSIIVVPSIIYPVPSHEGYGYTVMCTPSSVVWERSEDSLTVLVHNPPAGGGDPINVHVHIVPTHSAHVAA